MSKQKSSLFSLKSWALVACLGVSLSVFAEGDAVRGKTVYKEVGCYLCHGTSGQGGFLNYAAPSLAHTQYSAEVLKIFVRTGPRDMPAFSEKVLSDSDLNDIHAYLQSLPGPSDPKKIPILNY
jgi:ubiquinol-cytochrome c reductase cytochrome c subunit